MSGFDELADEISDEDWDAAWEAYTSGADPLGSAATFRGFIELPIGIVEVRGDDIGLTSVFPTARLGSADVDLTDPDAVLDVTGSGPVNWSVTNRRSGVTESGSCAESTDAAGQLLDALIRLDQDNIYLDIQMVDNGRLGVGLVDVTGDPDRSYDSGPWLGSEWVVLSHDLVVLRPGSRTVTALRLVSTAAGSAQLRVERSTIDILVFIRSSAVDTYGVAPGDDDQLDTVRALFEQVRLSRRSMSFDEVSLVMAVIEEVVAGALSLPVSKKDLADVPFGLTQLVRDDQLSVLDPRESTRRRWRARVTELLAPIAHVASNASTLPRSSGHAILIGSALDFLDRGVPVPLAADRPEAVPPTTLEFLVEPDDREAFESDLLEAGLQPVAASVSNRDLHATTHRAFRAVVDPRLEELVVVTTTTVGTGLFAGLLDLEDFFKMSVPIRVGSVWMRGLDPMHRFILGCIRFSSGADENTSRAMALHNLPWNRLAVERVVRLADRCGALTPVRNTVRELRHEVPSVLRPVLEDLLG